MTQTSLGIHLTYADQKRVLASFPYRMTHESSIRWPAATQVMIDGGYRLFPLLSDAQWLSRTRFAIRKDGRLDNRFRFANPA